MVRLWGWSRGCGVVNDVAGWLGRCPDAPGLEEGGLRAGGLEEDVEEGHQDAQERGGGKLPGTGEVKNGNRLHQLYLCELEVLEVLKGKEVYKSLYHS